MLDTARSGHQAGKVTEFEESRLWREGENARHIIQHMRVSDGTDGKRHKEFESGCADQSCERVPRRRRLSPFNPSDTRLRRAGPLGERSLRQPGAGPAVQKELACTHD